MTNTTNKPKYQGAVVDAILQKMGGIRPMAQKLGVSVSTVQGWKQRQMIPTNRVHGIDVYFQQHFNMTLADFCNTSETAQPTQKSAIPKTTAQNTTKTHAEKTADIDNTPRKTPSKNPAQKPQQKKFPKIITGILYFCITVVVVVISQSPIGKDLINQIYGYTPNKANSKTDFVTQSDIQNTINPLQKQIYDMQSDMGKMQNTLGDVQTTQRRATADISQTNDKIQSMQDISKNMSTLYGKMDTMTQQLQMDITQIKNSVAIKTVYETQWRTLYMLITAGQPYGEILSTITIPKTPDTKLYWDIINTHKNGVISPPQIRTAIYENAFLIAPALADTGVNNESSLMDRVRAKFTHFVFVTATPDGQNTSKNTDIDKLFNAVNNNDIGYFVRILKPLNIPEIQPLLDRISNRNQVLNAMRNIWANLPQGDK